MSNLQVSIIALFILYFTLWKNVALKLDKGKSELPLEMY